MEARPGCRRSTPSRLRGARQEFFPPAEAPGEIFGAERLHQVGHAEAAAQAGLQVASWRPSSTPSRSTRRSPTSVAVGHEGLGDGEGRDPLRPRLLPPHRPHRREARQLPRARRRRLVDRRVRRQDADPGRARRVELPQRRPARHVRGPRLHRLGRHQPGVHPREPQRQHAVHPDRVRLDDRRGARPQDAAAALAAGDGRAGRAGAASCSATRTPTPSCRSPAPSRSTS